MRNPSSRRHPNGEHRALPPLDSAGLDRLALRYVERFATTRARLADYLKRKIRERGWVGAPVDLAVLADRLSDIGYIDDRAFGEARATAMARRGLGKRRVDGALWQAGVAGDDAAALEETIAARALESAIIFARKKRIGPYAAELADRPTREKQIAAMIRGGHDFTLARRIASMMPGDDAAALIQE